MNEDQKRFFDSLEVLRLGAWTSFDNRRPYEWKLCFSVWAVMVGFMGVLLRGKTPLHPFIMTAFVFILACFIIFLQFKWIRGLTRANTIDKKQAIFFRDAMMANLGLTFSKEIQGLLTERDKDMGKVRDWSSWFQICITILLAMASIVTIWVK